ncbi:teichoic acid ABC transporter permease [Virgibacillus soli]|nr:teichoic acid ABC transporter permease [Virgibacillus soli]
MKSISTIIREQFQHFYLLLRLSQYELKSQNKNNYFGTIWELINPLIQILIYWFVFGTIRSRADVEMSNGFEAPYILWMVCGFMIWTFIYQSLIQGSKSIYTRLRMLSKMNFPMSVIPNIAIFSQLYIHLSILLIVIILFNVSGIYINIYYIQLLYYLFATVTLLFAISLITSTLSTLIRDVHMFLNATLRMFLYVSPILWPVSNFFKGEKLLTLIKLNPFYYLIEGYRASLFGTEWYFIEHINYTLYFWALTIVLFIIGAKLHLKFREHFIDFL